MAKSCYDSSVRICILLVSHARSSRGASDDHAEPDLDINALLGQRLGHGQAVSDHLAECYQS